eukprot:scaffold145_cov195-Alexandrium_tamarense.AAC.20
MLLPIAGKDTSTFSLFVLGITFSILLRYYVMQKQIKRVTSTPLWNATLDRQKREALFVVITSVKPSDINKFEDMTVRYVTYPTKIAAAVVCGIVNMLHNKLGDEEEKMKLLVTMALFIVGGIGIGGMRHGSLGMDCFFRSRSFGELQLADLQLEGSLCEAMCLKELPSCWERNAAISRFGFEVTGFSSIIKKEVADTTS